MNWPGGEATAEVSRIRCVVLVLFKRWFGRSPTEYWHKDGFMAEAWDRRGNRIEVTQINFPTPQAPNKKRCAGAATPAQKHINHSGEE